MQSTTACHHARRPAFSLTGQAWYTHLRCTYIPINSRPPCEVGCIENSKMGHRSTRQRSTVADKKIAYSVALQLYIVRYIASPIA